MDKEVLSESFSTLIVNKLRTGLAILGIVIGIGSVIALISLGQSSQKSVENQIQSLGSNILTVSPSGQNSGAVRGAAGGGVAGSGLTGQYPGKRDYATTRVAPFLIA